MTDAKTILSDGFNPYDFSYEELASELLEKTKTEWLKLVERQNYLNQPYHHLAGSENDIHDGIRALNNDANTLPGETKKFIQEFVRQNPDMAKLIKKIA